MCLLGPSSHHKGHKCLNVAGQIFISRSVKFDEADFPFSTKTSQNNFNTKSMTHILLPVFSPPPTFTMFSPAQKSSQSIQPLPSPCDPTQSSVSTNPNPGTHHPVIESPSIRQAPSDF